jgi:hypothetical protein
MAIRAAWTKIGTVPFFEAIGIGFPHLCEKKGTVPIFEECPC